MRGRKIEIEELDELLEGADYKDLAKSFITEAIENGASVYTENDRSFKMIVNVPEMEFTNDRGTKTVGLFISVYGKGYRSANLAHIWVAIEDSYGIRDGVGIGEFDLSEGYKTIISKAVKVSGTCDWCNKDIGLPNLIHVGFANKVCKDCYPAAKAKLEYPSWTK